MMLYKIIKELGMYVEENLMIPYSLQHFSKIKEPQSAAISLSSELESISEEIEECKLCRLYAERNKTVPGYGNSNAKLMIIGEAPGEEEDKRGLPFVGTAGELLTKMLTAIDINREDVFITNAVKCRPPGNRTPDETELSACKPFLFRQIAEIKPEIILILGGVALKTIKNDEYCSISKQRGKIFQFNNITCLATYHPSYLLRKPTAKAETWSDLKLLKNIFKEKE